LWLLFGKHGFLRKQRLINNGFFVRDVCLFVFVGSGGWNPDPLFLFLVVSCSSSLWFLGFPFLWSLGSLLFCLSGFVSSFPLWFYKAKPREKFDPYLPLFGFPPLILVILYVDNYFIFFCSVFGWIRTPTVLPLLDCWWWVSLTLMTHRGVKETGTKWDLW